jgi:hypothetical protein
MAELNEFEPTTINFVEYKPKNTCELVHLRRDYYNHRLPKSKYEAIKHRTDRSKNETHLTDKAKQFKRKHKQDDKSKRSDRQYKLFQHRQMFIQMIDDEFQEPLRRYNRNWAEDAPYSRYNYLMDGENDSDDDIEPYSPFDADASEFIKSQYSLSK